MTDIKWKPFSLTYVEYPEDDSLGKILAISSLAPAALIVGFATLIIFRRDLHTIAFSFGCLLNEAANLIIKRIIAQPRPITRKGLYTEYGMPSSHSQLMWFFCSYSILFFIFRLRHINSSVLELIWKSLVALGLICASMMVCYSRVYLLYHTWSQVICGGILGIAFGVGWFSTTHIVLTPYFPVIASWRISERLMIRDTSLIPNVMWFEYTNARQENRSRSRKLTSMKSQ